ncbi:hypothetical protein BCU68_01255 [Vibrio sp. 10N.286.49.B3]|uniref:RluA family pseudouridine synthase n=1 Tax=Vibrio sp. 10N.286.49.B3 TaxID=1880855 RepID=UPI000C821A0F|nr:RluA family pseudouridine synthase [Vibrio sp. 10N.286.49.B3]PMH46691.1 hypothetical protein BCU68_01255 [Vibrio sp. 10N.286.49.B3]
MTDNPHPYLRSFKSDISCVDLPNCFPFPYYYTPHALSELAMEALQAELIKQPYWQEKNNRSSDAIGAMFGVLVVELPNGNIGYLCSYAGSPIAEADAEQFVPPVYDIQQKQALLRQHQHDLSRCQDAIEHHHNSQESLQLLATYAAKQQQAEQDIADFQTQMTQAKAQRKQTRSAAQHSANPDELNEIIKQLGIASSKEKSAFKTLKQSWASELAALEQQVAKMETVTETLTQAYQQQVTRNQQQLTDLCHFNAYSGNSKTLSDILADDPSHALIIGSEDENAPKLLNYAFKAGLKPLTIGEFWWGNPPAKEVRQHKNIYPVCQSRCFEILTHMLNGLAMDPNPLIINPALGKSLEIVYEDEVLVVVNKPAEFLSVSGKSIEDSVHSRIKARYPHATGPLIVHRLDMSTSGLLVLTLNPQANKHIQQQFIQRTVAKRYTALLEGALDQAEGKINLPLAGDITDRPRQLVCFAQGRSAETRFEVVSRHTNQAFDKASNSQQLNSQQPSSQQPAPRTKVHLYPKTGRTHQLRVHCAHHLGLGMPIVGDDLYGYKDQRLYLHAGYLAFQHPVTGETMEFEVADNFMI